MKNRAFTSVELGLCIAAIGCTAAVTLPVFRQTRDHQYQNMVDSNRHMYTSIASELYSADLSGESIKTPPPSRYKPYDDYMGGVDCQNPPNTVSGDYCAWTGINNCLTVPGGTATQFFLYSHTGCPYGINGEGGYDSGSPYTPWPPPSSAY